MRHSLPIVHPKPRPQEADRVGTGICLHCGLGCAQLIYAKGGNVIHICV